MKSPPLADPAEFAARLNLQQQQELSRSQLQALHAASNRFRLEVRHDVHESVTEDYLDGHGGYTLNLPAIPVTDIELLEIEGEPVTVGIGPQYVARWSRMSGVLKLSNRVFPVAPQAVRVRYRHGYSTNWDSEDPLVQASLVPEELQNEVLNFAQYLYTVVGEVGLGVQNLTVGARSVTYSAAAYNFGVAESLVAAVNKYSLGRGGSV